jgi:hypothetical protein
VRNTLPKGSRPQTPGEGDDLPMGDSVAIHVLTGSGRLLAHADRIRSHARAATSASLAALPLSGGVDVVVHDDPRRVIPEVGIGGVAPDGHTVFVVLDPDHETFEQAVDRELFPALAHELLHATKPASADTPCSTRS